MIWEMSPNRGGDNSQRGPLAVTLSLPAPPGRRRTKIVATVGPASRNEACLRSLLAAGVDVVRLNFSHGTHEEHKQAIQDTRRLARDLGRPVAVLQDLQGPRLRIGTFKGGSVELRSGQTFTLSTREVEGSADQVSINYAKLPDEVRVGDTVLLDDGRIRLRVVGVSADVICRVEEGGLLASRKGMNLPGVELNTPPFTEKDRRDLEFGLRMGVDFVALSFVRGPQDARALRELMAGMGKRVPIIAKIERAQAVDALEEILRAFDGVMVARGDLGVEIGPERVPLIQKQIIRKAITLMKPVITATQMLESMVTSPTATRAEASDVANAILDGTDAIMLSAETSIGAFPLEAVKFMDRIAGEADVVDLAFQPPSGGAADPARAVVRAAHELAREVNAKAIALFTSSGRTGTLIAKHRPQMPAIAFTRTAAVYHRLALWWGVTPIHTTFTDQATDMVAYAEEVLVKAGFVRARDRIVIVGSAPLTARGRTNFIKVHTVRERNRRPSGPVDRP